jgi:orotidine-5'-phosphate decarboxylase
MKRIIEEDKSVIVAADISSFGELKKLAQEVRGVPGISAFKIGFRLAFKGVATVVGIIKSEFGNNPVIYDHQKAGNDIPKMGQGFAEDLKAAGVDAVILFPFTGPKTQEMWTKACFEVGLNVMTGGIMTHEQFLVSEGGYISDNAPERIYRNACQLGVEHFIVPGNKLDWVKKIRGWLIKELGEGNFTLSAPGFITQKGIISECGLVAGPYWHAIVGSGIYGAKNIREAAIAVTRQIV